MDLFDLLPQSQKTQVPDHLKFSKALSLVEFLTEQLLDAIKAFYIDQNLFEFDPHVGETACQIRAYQVLNYFNKSNDRKNITIRYNYFMKTLHKIKHDIKYFEIIDSSRKHNNVPCLSLSEFLISNEFFYEINEVEFFLVQARILTLFKSANCNGDHIIDYIKLTKAMGVSKNTAREFVHLFQINLSKLSCNFIFELIDQIPNFAKTETPISLVKNDDDGRYVLPHFFTSKILYYHMVETKQKVLLIAHRTSNNYCIDNIYFPLLLSEKKTFAYCPEYLDQSQQAPYYVIQGITNYDPCQPESQQAYISRLLRLGFKRTFLCNMASHQQFSGKRLAGYSTNPFKELNQEQAAQNSFVNEYEKLKGDAYFWGCNFTNQSLFYIKHIYCDKYSHLKGINFKHSIDIYNKINKNHEPIFDFA